MRLGHWEIWFNRHDYRERTRIGVIINKHIVSDGGYPYTISTFPSVKHRYFFALPWAAFQGWRKIQEMHHHHEDLGYTPEYE